jgi:NAD(P)H dehydrogenase (quinone)
MLLITGANGNLARAAITEIRKLIEPRRLAVTTRDAKSAYAKELLADGITVRTADFDVPETLSQAFDGVSRALIISSAAADTIRVQQNTNAIAAAKAAGVKHLVYTSFMNASPNACLNHTRLAHYPTEVALVASGLTYTIMRNAIFAEAMIWSLDRSLGVLRRPAPDVPLTFITRGDCGLAAATILTAVGHENKTYTLTMSRSYLAEEIARLVSESLGKSIQLDLMSAKDWPAELADVISAMKSGELRALTGDFKRITGREPQDMRVFLDECKNAKLI